MLQKISDSRSNSKDLKDFINRIVEIDQLKASRNLLQDENKKLTQINNNLNMENEKYKTLQNNSEIEIENLKDELNIGIKLAPCHLTALYPVS